MQPVQRRAAARFQVRLIPHTGKILLIQTKSKPDPSDPQTLALGLEQMARTNQAMKVEAASARQK